MNKLIAFAALALAGVCFAIAFLVPNPARAAECSMTVSAAVADTQANGGELVDLVDVPAIAFDQVLFVTMGGLLWTGYAKDGCLVTPPMPIGDAPTGPPKTPA